MNRHVSMPFAAQRMVCRALVFGMVMFAIAAGVMVKLNDDVGLIEAPVELLDTVALIAGIALASIAVFVRILMTKKALAVETERRATLRFLSRIVPIVILEAGCLLALTVWMLNGNAIPSLAVACVLLSIAIAMIPTQDPDADVI